MGEGLNAMIIDGGIEKLSFLEDQLKHQIQTMFLSQLAHKQNTKEQEGNSLKGEVQVRGKNQEDVFRQLLQSNSKHLLGLFCEREARPAALGDTQMNQMGSPPKFSGED